MANRRSAAGGSQGAIRDEDFFSSPARASSPSKASPKMGMSKGIKATIIVSVSILILIAAFIGMNYLSSHDKVHNGVSVAGIDLGGMTKQQAQATLEKKLASDLSRGIELTAGDQKWSVTSDTVGASYDAKKLASQAYDVGKEGSLGTLVSDNIKGWFTQIEVPFDFKYDNLVFGQFMNVVEPKTVTPAVESTVKIEGTSVDVVDGKDGTKIDQTALKHKLTNAFTTDRKSVELPIVTAKMKITPQIAQDAAKVTQTMVSGPAVVSHDTKDWTFGPKTIGSWISFDATQTDGKGPWKLEPKIDPEKASADVKSELGELGVMAQNAKFEFKGNGITIKPSVQGTGVDIKALSRDLTDALKTSDQAQRKVAVKIDKVDPEITTAKAQSMGIKQKISEYTTTFSTGALNRNTNIRLMGEHLDGSLVAPGAVWDYWEVGGNTTADKGYKAAGAISEGELVNELGGGICQVATTVFNAVFESGFPVVQRSPHSLYISHYPTGRDAAVSWQQPDLRWKNDSKNWVLVHVTSTNSSITVSLWGTDPGYTVTSSTGPWYNFTSPKTKTIKDPTLKEGTTRVKSSGQGGKSVKVTRTVSKGGKVIRTDVFNSTYKASPKVVVVGTKKPPSESKPTTSTP